MRDDTMTLANPKLAGLLDRKSKLEAQIAKIEAVEKVKARKTETRYKIVFGSSLLADVERHPELREVFVTSLRRSVTADRDKALLRSMGWEI